MKQEKTDMRARLPMQRVKAEHEKKRVAVTILQN